MAGKDTKFKKIYTIEFSGISKIDKQFGDTQTFQEKLFDSMVSAIVYAHNYRYKTTKAKLEIKKII